MIQSNAVLASSFGSALFPVGLVQCAQPWLSEAKHCLYFYLLDEDEDAPICFRFGDDVFNSAIKEMWEKSPAEFIALQTQAALVLSEMCLAYPSYLREDGHAYLEEPWSNELFQYAGVLLAMSVVRNGDAEVADDESHHVVYGAGAGRFMRHAVLKTHGPLDLNALHRLASGISDSKAVPIVIGSLCVDESSCVALESLDEDCLPDFSVPHIPIMRDRLAGLFDEYSAMVKKHPAGVVLGAELRGVLSPGDKEEWSRLMEHFERDMGWDDALLQDVEGEDYKHMKGIYLILEALSGCARDLSGDVRLVRREHDYLLQGVLAEDVQIMANAAPSYIFEKWTDYVAEFGDDGLRDE